MNATSVIKKGQESAQDRFNGIPVGILILNEEHHLVTINERGCEILGIDLESTLDDTLENRSTSILNLLPDSQREAWRGMIVKGWTAHSEVVVPKYGHFGGPFERILRLHISTNRRANKPPQLFIVLDDITDMVGSENHARDKEQSSAQDEMVTTMSHKLNNFLTIIGNNAALIKHCLDTKDHDRAMSAADRISSQVMKIKAFTEKLARSAQPSKD